MSNFKQIAAKGLNPSISPQNLVEYTQKTGNLYEAIAIISKRSNQLNVEMKNELQAKLNEFASSTDSLEEIHENREQIEISKFYERLPHPVLISSDEFFSDEIYHRTNPVVEVVATIEVKR